MDNVARRILFVLENAGAGSGRHVLDLSKGLITRGYDVTLVYSHARLEDWFAGELRSLPELHTHTIDMRSGLGLTDVTSLRTLRQFIREHGPFDIVHGHSSKGGALSRLATGANRAVRVYTPHAFYTLGAEPGSGRYRFFAALETFLARRCDGIICVSEAERRHAIGFGMPADKLFVVPNGLVPLTPVDRQLVRADLGLAPEEVAIGFVGRLARQKAVHRLIEAFATVRQSLEQARLVIVGDGPDAPAARELVAARGVTDSVIFTGAAPGPRLMAGFDVFACSSLYEAFPYVFLEAMARGLPIVSTRVGGIDEVLEPGVNGQVVEQGDAAGLARALLETAGDGERRQAMGQASLKRIELFGVDNMVEATIAVYDQLLAGSRGAGPAG